MLAGLSTLSLMFGGPVPAPYALIVSGVLSFIALGGGLTIFVLGYRTAPVRTKQQLNWIASGLFLAVVVVVVSHVVSSIVEEPLYILLAAEWSTLLLPAALVLAILKADMAGVDRTAVLTATFAFIAVTLAVAFEYVLEPLAGLVSQQLGLEEAHGQTALIILAALGAPNLKKRIQPVVERYLAVTEADREELQSPQAGA